MPFLPAWLSTRGFSYFRSVFHPVTGWRFAALVTVHLSLLLLFTDNKVLLLHKNIFSLPLLKVS